MKQNFFKVRSCPCLALLIVVPLIPCIFLTIFSNISTAGVVSYTAEHTFSINDVQGGFDGMTYPEARTSGDLTIICGGEGMSPCPSDAVQPFVDQQSGMQLYPVDSDFGYYVADFVGAAQKVRDGDYAEGWVANVLSGGEVVGLMVSNAETDTFKVPTPLGTWCAGLGGKKVKCSTEHFTVLEHIKTCYETNPYMYSESDGSPGILYDPDPAFGQVVGTCADGRLDNQLFHVVDGVTDYGAPLLIDDEGNPVLIANESSVRNDIAAGMDYSITKKDDGKALYRFGSMVKRPNDIRLYARMPLPEEWTAADAPAEGFAVTKAELHIDHLITNNPNDQVRPEDMENEGATGRLPGYIDLGLVWVSDKLCYEGDGDFIPAGTVFKDSTFALNQDPLQNESTDPVPYSEDLKEGFTNAWYTTTDRDPFETGQASGPRWRLKANKFGQDLPGLELPVVNCMATPYTSQYIKYQVGEATTTVLDLLDFEDDLDLDGDDSPDPSPLLNSNGWIKPNGVNEVALDGEGNDIIDEQGRFISVNGLPLTEDFDLAVYVKGDRKPTAVYNARLVIEYENDQVVDPPPPPSGAEFDLSLDSLKAPNTIFAGTSKNIVAFVTNNGPDVAEGTLILDASYLIEGVSVSLDLLEADISAIAPGETVKLLVPWSAPSDVSADITVNWTVTIEADGDTTDFNNEKTGTSRIRPPK